MAHVQYLSSNWSNTLQTPVGRTKGHDDQLARDPGLSGSAGIGASGALRAGKGGPLSGSADLKAGLDGRSSDTRRTDQGVSTSTQNTDARSEEHTSELQSLMRISYAVFCLKKKK